MRVFRWSAYAVAILVGAIVGLLIIALVVGAVVLETTIPDYGGEDRIAGLSDTVTVLRDDNAVPHIYASDVHDAYRALGYVHAQDRFFQMEFARRVAAGRLAEIVGPAGLRTDRFMRLLGVGRAAEASVAAMSPDTRAAVDAYVEGVNAWIRSDEATIPPEFFLLGHEPEPWRAADSAAWGRMMALLLSGDWRGELLRARLAEDLGPARLRDLWPVEPADAPTTLTALPGDMAQRLAAAVPDIWPAGSASNEWAVGAGRSESGSPLLANDPHLGLSAPGMWHLARIVAPGFTASGAAFPGQPFFMIGQNGHVAWGLTTTHADTQDLFVERVDPDDPGRYRLPDGSAAFETREETIDVRWFGPETIRVRATRHGPVISDLVGSANAHAGEDRVLALSFPGLAADDRTADAVHAMNHARDAAAFRAALRDFGAPVQNIVFADTDGAVGFVAAGRIPVRPRGDGALPAEGWSGDDDWRGFIPFDALPQEAVQRDGAVVNANNRVVGEDYPYTIAAQWPESYRAERIRALLDERAVHSPTSFAAIQRDILSPAARRLVPLLLDRLPAGTSDEPAARMLAEWDGRMARERPEPAIFTAWLRAVQRRLVADELGAAFADFRGLRPRMVERMLTERPGWCDDVTTPAHEDCPMIVAAAWRDAIELLSARFGDDPARWRWGEAHRARFSHRMLGRLPLLRELFDVTIEADGGDFTVNRATPDLDGGRDLFTSIHGPGFRAIFDLADPDGARYMLAPGQSGHPRSPYYGNLAEPWRDGRYLLLNVEFELLREKAIATLRLTP